MKDEQIKRKKKGKENKKGNTTRLEHHLMRQTPLQRHQHSNSSKQSSNTSRLHASSTVISRLSTRLLREGIGIRRSGTVLALARNGLLVIPRRGNGVGRRGLGPGDNGAAGRRSDCAVNVVQSRRAVAGVVAWLVEFVGGVLEAEALAFSGVEVFVAGAPGPVGEGVV